MILTSPEFSNVVSLNSTGVRWFRGLGNLSSVGALRHGVHVHPWQADSHDLPQSDPLALHQPGAERAADRTQQQPVQLRPRSLGSRSQQRRRCRLLHGQAERRRESGGERRRQPSGGATAQKQTSGQRYDSVLTESHLDSTTLCLWWSPFVQRVGQMIQMFNLINHQVTVATRLIMMFNINKRDDSPALFEPDTSSEEFRK